MTTTITTTQETNMFEAIAKEITIRPDGGTSLSQRGTARLLGINESTLRVNLQGARKNGKMYGGNLGKHLVSKGFQLRGQNESRHGTKYDDEMLTEIAMWYAFTKGNEQARTIIHATANLGLRTVLTKTKESFDSKPKQLPAEVIALVLPAQTHHTVVEMMLMMGYNGQEISEHQNRLGRAFAAHFRFKYRDEPLPLSNRGNGARRTCKVHVYLADNPDYAEMMEEIIGYLPE